MRRVLTLIITIITALVLQTTVFSEITLLGAKPELMYLVTIVFALLEGPAAGAIAGFAGGMAQDFFLNTPKGITALALVLLGYVVGLLRTYIVSQSPALPTLLVAIGTFAGLMFHALVSFLLGQVETPLPDVVRIAALASLYNAILTPLLFPVLRRAAEGSQPQRIGRW